MQKIMLNCEHFHSHLRNNIFPIKWDLIELNMNLHCRTNSNKNDDLHIFNLLSPFLGQKKYIFLPKFRKN